MHGSTQNKGVAESSRDIPYCNLVTTHSSRDWRKECLSENVCVPFVLNCFNEDLYHETIMSRRVLLIKRCSENMQQIYRKTPMSNYDFNKIAAHAEVRFQ